MSIPENIKNLPIWTLSTPDKVPIDAGALYTGLGYVPFTEKRFAKCYTYDKCKKVQSLYPDTKMTIKATAENNITLVDIEKEGNLPFNPYLKLDFVYLEKSTNGGIHGLLPYTLDVRSIIKDVTLQTEFFNDNHFMIITENEIELKEPLYTLYDFIDRFKTDVVINTDIPDVNTEEIIEISDFEKNVIKSGIDIPEFEIKESDDKSQVEFKYMMSLGYKILEIYTPKDINHFISLLEYACYLHLPYRKKHYQEINAEGYGRVTKRKYSMIKSAEYVYQNED